MSGALHTLGIWSERVNVDSFYSMKEIETIVAGPEVQFYMVRIMEELSDPVLGPIRRQQNFPFRGRGNLPGRDGTPYGHGMMQNWTDDDVLTFIIA